MIKKIKLISNNICYGPCPEPSAEVEQHLTINSAGKVWFSARNYEQYLAGKGFCRKKQVNIGTWKASFLLNLINKADEGTFVTDVGDYELIIKYDDESKRRIHGSLAGDIKGCSYGNKPISLTKLMRRYVPIYALWGFGGNLSPDYEGKKAVYLFADKWEKKFATSMIIENEFEERFGDECIALGFQMDCGKEAERLYPGCLRMNDFDPEAIVNHINDIDLIGSAVFSQWRYLTHWAGVYELNYETCQWFSAMLRQLKKRAGK